MSKKTKKTEWSKNCPECDSIQYYSSKGNMKRAVDTDMLCVSCSQMGNRNPNYGLSRSESHRRAISIANMGNQNMLGKHHTEETKQKIRLSKLGDKNPMYGGYGFTDEHKLKLRLASIRAIEARRGQVMPNYNPSSIPIIEQKAKELGITDLQHAENGGEYHIKELGYWVDGYSKEKNIVIEYYEPFHNKTVERDERRETEITEHLGCKFLIIKDNG